MPHRARYRQYLHTELLVDGNEEDRVVGFTFYAEEPSGEVQDDSYAFSLDGHEVTRERLEEAFPNLDGWDDRINLWVADAEPGARTERGREPDGEEGYEPVYHGDVV